HADPPAAIEAYWQEIGRAGCDGAPAEGITRYSSSDLAWAMRRIDSRDMDASVKAVQMRKVRQLYAMLEGTSCRPAAVRRYFGESGVTACGQCDLCLNPPEAADATEAAQKALSAVHRLGGRLGRGRVVDHLLGKTKDVSGSEAAMSTYGIGREFSAAGWRDLLDQLLFEALRVWRRERAAEQHVPPYVIFHDATLSAIARQRPASLDALAKISGVGQSKLKRYGADVLKVVREI